MNPEKRCGINISIIHSLTNICFIDNLAAMMGDLDLKAEARAVTGVLASHPDARDIQIESLSITFHGAELLTDTACELNNGRRYGLIGTNGCGK